jgi:hypothetical protein
VGHFSISATSFLTYDEEIMRKINCDEAKKFDMVDYLASLGHLPMKIRNQEFTNVERAFNIRTLKE